MAMIYYSLAGAALVIALSFALRTDRYEDVCVATAVVAFVLVLLPLAPIEAWLRPLTWDGVLRRWDLALGLDGFALARFCFRHGWARVLFGNAYSALPLAFAVNWALERSKLFFHAAAIGAIAAVPFYMLVPACGPQYAFAGYPWHASVPAGLIAVSTLHPRNCFPSMHFAWALLLAMNAKGRLWKSTLAIYATLVALATVAGGEHYFVDVIFAVPFTLAVHALAGRLSSCGAERETYRATAPVA
jgi:hypothetical protein